MTSLLMMGVVVTMELDFLWIGLGLAAFGYFIGDGLKNFKNPDAKNTVEKMFSDDDQNELIKETDLHWYIGIRKSDVNTFINNYPDIPHLEINGHIYYPKEQLQHWLKELGSNVVK